MAITDPPYGYHYPNTYYPHYYTYYPAQQVVQQGWECPKCGRVYSPSMIMCTTCGNDKLTVTTDTFTVTTDPNLKVTAVNG